MHEAKRKRDESENKHSSQRREIILKVVTYLEEGGDRKGRANQ